MTSGAYSTTSVPLLQSIEEVRKLVMSHGGVGFRYTQVPEGITIEWGWTKGGQNFLARLPVRFDFSPRPGRYVGQKVALTEAQREQEMRTKARSLMYYLKATYDAIDKGIVLQEQAFMGDLLMRLPNGDAARTMDVLLPQIAAGQAVNADLNRLMLAEGGKEQPKKVEAELVTDPDVLRRFER